MPAGADDYDIIVAGGNRVLVQSECLSQEAFEPVSHNSRAAGLTDRDTESRMVQFVGRDVDGKKSVTAARAYVEDSPELGFFEQSSILAKA